MDYSDFEAKVKWAKENDDLAKKIAENGQQFARAHLTDEQSHCYMFLLILEMARLMGLE